MKRFLNKILTFGLVFLGYVLLNITINLVIFHNTELDFENTSILVAGDSHPQRAINPKLLRSASSITQSAEPYVLTYWKLKYFLKRIEVDTLLLGYAHHNISEFNDIKLSHNLWSWEMFKRTYLILNPRDLVKFNFDYSDFIEIYFFKAGLYPKKSKQIFQGRYKNNDRNDLNNKDEGLERHYYIDGELAKVSELSILYLNKILKLCEEYNIVPILLATPVHEYYFTNIPEHMKERFELEKTKFIEQNITVYDLTTTYYPEEEYMNMDHINIKGSKRIATWLNNKFSKVDVKEQYLD